MPTEHRYDPDGPGPPDRPVPRGRADRLPRRVTDRIEDGVAWLLAAAALLLVLGSVLAGFSMQRTEAERGRIQTAERSRVEVVLLEDAPTGTSPPGEQGPRVRVPARWTGPDGIERVAPVPVPRYADAGDVVTVWMDRTGAVVPAPGTPTNAVVAGVLAATGLLLAGGTSLAAIWVGVRWLTGAVNAAGWEREWARVGPRWTGHLR